MGLILVLLAVIAVVSLYFSHNPLNHSRAFMFRRFVNWFPLGMSYAFLYMARYNLNVAKNALGSKMSIDSFGTIFAVGTIVYGLSFLLVGPLVDRIGGRKGILIATVGASVANIMMGVATYLFLHGRLSVDMTLTFAVLYAFNMFCQSYGAVSIIKVKSYWFHVRERGLFGAIFGTLISFGVYFAFDGGQAIADAAKAHVSNPTALQNLFNTLFGTNSSEMDATWMVFFIPAAFLLVWAVLDFIFIQDTPAEAGHEDFDTHDASSGEMDREFSKMELLKRIFTNPVIMMVAFIEFTTGVVRNGIMQWYFVFAKEVPQVGAEFFKEHWGLILCVTGIGGAFLAGWVSDKIFHSRRGPPVAIFGGFMVVITILMTAIVYTSPIGVGLCAVTLGFLSISVHSLMSGTAAADFGGRKATATASGITDGFVYLGTGIQSFALKGLVTQSWTYWPAFLIPFAIIGTWLAVRMWRSLPEATKHYLAKVENVTIDTVNGTHIDASIVSIQTAD
jgi:OPA family glycerol-3-phosphate transporter-like MFS transporter